MSSLLVAYRWVVKRSVSFLSPAYLRSNAIWSMYSAYLEGILPLSRSDCTKICNLVGDCVIYMLSAGLKSLWKFNDWLWEWLSDENHYVQASFWLYWNFCPPPKLVQLSVHVSVKVDYLFLANRLLQFLKFDLFSCCSGMF